MAEVPKKVVTVVEDSPKVVVDPEERQRKLQQRREKDRANRAKKQAKGAPSTAEGTAARAAEKRPRQEGDELLAELEKKRRGLESSIHDVMGGTEVPLVNAFLTSVKIDAGELARTKATDFSDRVQKTVLSTANAFGDMYLTLAKAEREVALARRHSETAKAATAEAQAALRERNALQLKVGRLEWELKETARRLEAVEEARLESERRRSEELAKMVARFNLDLDINFDTSGVPLPIPAGRELLFASTPSAEASSPSEAETRGGADASGGESTVDPDTAADDDRADA
ncbi:unnamed protein product [Prunus brigantina]